MNNMPDSHAGRKIWRLPREAELLLSAGGWFLGFRKGV